MLTGKDLGEAIARAITLKGVKVRDVADHFRIKPPSVYNWLETGRIDKGKLFELFAYFADVVGPEHWGVPSGSPLHPSASTTPPAAVQPVAPGPEYVLVERVALKVSAGITGFALEHLDGNGQPLFFPVTWITAKGYKPDKLFALSVHGDSMEPSLFDGDLVVINADDTQPKDCHVYVLNYEGEVVIKRIERDAGDWWLVSDNPRYRRKRCHEQSLIIGKVVYRETERI